MTHSKVTLTATGSREEVLARVLEEITQAVEAGEPIELAAYEAKYPQYIARIREILPAVEALGEIGFSFVRSSSSPQRPARPARAVSGTLGDFRILREIGRGGMGVVYEAE